MAVVRLMAEGEQGAFARSVVVPFLETGDTDAEEHWGRHLEVGRTWVADDGGRVVGQCCVFSRDVTVPGAPGAVCPVVPMAAVSGVGVLPTDRRQGLLKAMMTGMIADARERGEALATLLASEAVIYGRFGFGPAVSFARTRIDPRRAALRPDASPPPARVRLLDDDEAREVLPAMHDRFRRRRAGDVSRNDATWEDVWADRPGRREGMSANHYAVSDGAFAVYRGVEGSGGAPTRVKVSHLWAADADAEAAMWRWLTEIDLVDRLELDLRPVDDPIRWRLADPRRLETTWLGDFLWVRVLDTAAALTARGWHGSGRLVLDVVGDDLAAGRWVLDASPEGATCRPAGDGEATDIRLGVAELGSLYMGGVTPSTLALAGRLTPSSPRALAVADHLFPTPVAPFSGTGF